MIEAVVNIKTKKLCLLTQFSAMVLGRAQQMTDTRGGGGGAGPGRVKTNLFIQAVCNVDCY